MKGMKMAHSRRWMNYVKGNCMEQLLLYKGSLDLNNIIRNELCTNKNLSIDRNNHIIAYRAVWGAFDQNFDCKIRRNHQKSYYY